MASKTYTSNELRDLSNSELDAMVARVVMGWRISKTRFWWVDRKWRVMCKRRLWHPCQQWKYCGEVIERMTRRGVTFEVNIFRGGAAVYYPRHPIYPTYCRVYNNSPLRAVCIAAVLATQARAEWPLGRGERRERGSN